MLTDRLATLKKAESLARDGQIQEAIAEYLLLVEDQPGEWSAGNALGDLYLKAGQRDAAADVFVQMADSQRDQGFVPKAVALYKKALKARSADERALLGLADVAVAQEIFADARRYLEQVVSLRQARGDASGAAACAERLAQVPARRAPGARPPKSTLPTVPPPARDAVLAAPPPETLSLASEPNGTDVETADTLSLSLDGGAAAAVPAALMPELSVTAAEDTLAPAVTTVFTPVEPATGPPLVESFGVAPFEPTSFDAASFDAVSSDAISSDSDADLDGLTLSIDGPERAGSDTASAARLQDELAAAAHDADAVDLGALLDAPFTSPAPTIETAVVIPAPPVAATPPAAPEPQRTPAAAVREVSDEAPRAAAPRPSAPPASLAPRPTPAPPAAKVSSPPAASAPPVKVPPAPAKVPPRPAPAASSSAASGPERPDRTVPAQADPFAALMAPVPSGADESAPPDGDALMAELQAAALVPALRFQASAQLGRLLVERGDLPGAAAWLERAAQEPAPMPEHGLSVVYDLAVVCERMGQVARALALFAEIESESSAYRDVRARVARLSAGGGGPGA